MRALCRDLKADSRDRMLGNYSKFLGPLLLLFVCTLGTSLIPAYLFSGDTVLQYIMQFALTFLLSVLVSLLGAGLIKMSLQLADGQTTEFNDFLYAFRNQTDQFLKIEIIFSLISVVLSLPSLYVYFLYNAGTLSLMEYYGYYCGIVALSWLISTLIIMRLQWAVYLVIEEPSLSASAALKKSLFITKGRTGEIFYLTISFIGIYLLCICSFFVGFLYVRPYKEMTYVLYYKELKESCR